MDKGEVEKNRNIAPIYGLLIIIKRLPPSRLSSVPTVQNGNRSSSSRQYYPTIDSETCRLKNYNFPFVSRNQWKPEILIILKRSGLRSRENETSM